MPITNYKLTFYLLLVLSVPLSACNHMLSSSGNDKAQDSAARPSEAETTENANVKSSVPVQQIELDGDSLFNLLAAEFAGNSGNIEASLDYYREAAKTIDDSRIAARTAYIALYGEHYDEALSALDRWQELESGATDLPKMYAITYLKLEQPEKALPYIEEFLARSGDSSIDQAKTVKHLLAKEATTKDAYFVLQRLNAKKDKNIHLLVLQSRYAAQLQKYDESIVLLDQVLEIEPSLHEVKIIKFRILTAQGKKKEATALLQKLLTELPENTALRLQYARMLVEQNKLAEAAEQYSILYKKSPDNADVVLSYALLNIELKNLDVAVEALQHLVEIDKNVAIANYYLGRIAQNQADNKQAIAYYLNVKSGDYHYDAQLRVGILLALLGKPDEGVAKLEALAEVQTDWTRRVKSYLAQGEILRSEQRYKEGVEMYSRALQQKRDDTNLLYARGLMAEKVDRIDITEADLLKVISKEPDNANALNALGYTLADRTGRYQEALKYIKRAAELVPDDPAILDSLGWVSFRLGKMDDALKWLSKAFKMLEDAEIAAHYGEVLWHNNQKDKAREIWQKGKLDNADNPVLVETLNRIKP